jgi:hypothetical protein
MTGKSSTPLRLWRRRSRGCWWWAAGIGTSSAHAMVPRGHGWWCLAGVMVAAGVGGTISRVHFSRRRWRARGWEKITCPRCAPCDAPSVRHPTSAPRDAALRNPVACSRDSKAWRSARAARLIGSCDDTLNSDKIRTLDFD